MTVSTPVVVLKLYFHSGVGLVRTLGRMGVPVYVVADDLSLPAAHSRYITQIFEHDLGGVSESESVDFLGRVADCVGGRPILITSDDTTQQLVSRNTAALRERFVFPDQPSGLSERLLSKRGLHELCLEYGVPTPACSFPENREEAAETIAHARYPLLLKAIDNVPFARRNGIRMKIVNTAQEALTAYDRLEDPEAPNIMLQDYIPGDSDSVWVFTGYFDAGSELLFGAGGLKLRQYPVRTGTTCYGIVRSLPEMEALTRRFAKAIGYRGVFDCGYRYDPRDDQYKMLDVNPRVGANFRQCVGRDDLDVVRAMYLDLTGESVPADVADEGRRWWVENYDLLAAIDLARQGSLTAADWLRSVRLVDEPGWFARDDLAPFRRLCVRTLGTVLRRGLNGR